jgi:hypothetical protein
VRYSTTRTPPAPARSRVVRPTVMRAVRKRRHQAITDQRQGRSGPQTTWMLKANHAPAEWSYSCTT